MCWQKKLKQRKDVNKITFKLINNSTFSLKGESLIVTLVCLKFNENTTAERAFAITILPARLSKRSLKARRKQQWSHSLLRDWIKNFLNNLIGLMWFSLINQHLVVAEERKKTIQACWMRCIDLFNQFQSWPVLLKWPGLASDDTPVIPFRWGSNAQSSRSLSIQCALTWKVSSGHGIWFIVLAFIVSAQTNRSGKSPFRGYSRLNFKKWWSKTSALLRRL